MLDSGLQILFFCYLVQILQKAGSVKNMFWTMSWIRTPFKWWNFINDTCLCDIFYCICDITFCQNLPQNSSGKTNFKEVTVFPKWFGFVRVTSDERSVACMKIHWKILSRLLLLPIFILSILFGMNERIIVNRDEIGILM